MRFILHTNLIPVLIFVPILIVLGVWQLQRAEEKSQLQSQANIAKTYTHASPKDLAADSDVHRRPILVRGDFDNQHLWYLDNRIYRGKVGFEVIMPFRDERGWLLLVNRGFFAGTPDRKLPLIPSLRGMHVLRGHVYQPKRQPLVLRAEEPTSVWPQLIQSVNIESMWASLHSSGGITGFNQHNLFPYLMRLDENQIGVRSATWHDGDAIWLSAERHVGYAFTWFTLAAVLFLMNIGHIYSVSIKRGNK